MRSSGFGIFRAAELLLVSVLFAATVAAVETENASAVQAPYPVHRVTYKTLIGGRYNSFGAGIRFDVRYRLRLFDNPTPLFKDAHAGLGTLTQISPSTARFGPYIGISPLSILFVGVGYLFDGWFGTFNSIQSYPSLDRPYDDASRKGRAGYRTVGHEVTVLTSLMGKAGPFGAKLEALFVYSDQRLHGGDTVYYAPYFDMVAPDRGWLLESRLSAVYSFDFGLSLGFRGDLCHAFYRERHGVTNSNETRDTPNLRLGPLVNYTFFDRSDKRVNKPSVFLTVEWWLKHRYRTGIDGPQAVPYVALGVQFEGDLMRMESRHGLR